MKIYCIVDDNGLKYVGKTCKTLNHRLSNHKNSNTNRKCSSSKLDLDNCKIYLLQECSEEDSNEREHFWINGINCVNKRTNLEGTFNKKEWQKEYDKKNNYYLKNKDKKKEYQKNYYLKNKDKNTIKEYQKDYYLKNIDKIKQQKKEYYLKIKLKK